MNRIIVIITISGIDVPKYRAFRKPIMAIQQIFPFRGWGFQVSPWRRLWIRTHRCKCLGYDSRIVRTIFRRILENLFQNLGTFLILCKTFHGQSSLYFPVFFLIFHILPRAFELGIPPSQEGNDKVQVKVEAWKSLRKYPPDFSQNIIFSKKLAKFESSFPNNLKPFLFSHEIFCSDFQHLRGSWWVPY